MKKYKPKNEKDEIIRQLHALGVRVTAENGNILWVECDESIINQVKQITKKDFIEV